MISLLMISSTQEGEGDEWENIVFPSTSSNDSSVT